MCNMFPIYFLFGKKSKKDPRIDKINNLMEKMEINLHYFRTDKSRRYYMQIKELYKELPPELSQERKLITSKLEQILNNNKEAFSTIPKSSFLTNSWTINLKDFIEPSKGKVLVTLFAFIAVNILNLGIESNITGFALNPFLSPSSLISSPVISWRIIGSTVFLTSTIVYWYVLVSLIVFIVKKTKE